MKFGDKVIIKNKNAHQDLQNTEFCLIGFNDTAFAIVPWEKRGQYFFQYYCGNVENELLVVI